MLCSHCLPQLQRLFQEKEQEVRSEEAERRLKELEDQRVNMEQQVSNHWPTNSVVCVMIGSNRLVIILHIPGYVYAYAARSSAISKT